MRVGHYLRREERRTAVKSLVGAAGFRLLRPFLATQLRPSVSELTQAVGGCEVTGRDALQAVLPCAGDMAQQMCEAAEEYAVLRDQLTLRYESDGLPYPARWAVDSETSWFIYASVRIARPRCLVEIGVGNGHSTYYALNALRANGGGRLLSCDIAADVGGLVRSDERACWDLTILRQRCGDRGLAEAIAGLPAIDWCLHDGDHSYLGQREDLRIVWAKLRREGMLICDDADASRAFIEICRHHNVGGRVLIGERKALGVVRKGAERSARGLARGGEPQQRSWRVHSTETPANDTT